MPSTVLDFHRLTSHHPGRLPPQDPRLVHFQRMDWQRRPPPFKTYPGLEPTPLPDQLTPGAGPLDVTGLGRLLFWSAGVVRYVRLDGVTVWFRAVGSAGGLCPVEVYVVTGDLPGLPGGVYQYQPLDHALVRLREVPAATPPSVVLTGVPWRTGWKYAERGWRHLYWDAGTMLAHVVCLAESAGLSPVVELGFVDGGVAGLVGADGSRELPLAVVGLAGRVALPEAAPVPPGHLAPDPVEFPLVTAAQRAGDLASDEEVDAWRQAASGLAAGPATSSAASPLGERPEEVIRRRSSTRAFDPARTAPTEVLTAALAWATSPVPGDFVARGGTLLEHYLAVHRVAGVEPGAYRWSDGALEPLFSGAQSDATARLCLAQELGGQSAYTAFHCAPLSPVLAALGARGYRAAQLEAGVVHGRLSLAAFALGSGATGLTFFDDLVSSFFGTEAAPMLVTAVGAPARRARPAGEPRRPVQLRSLG